MSVRQRVLAVALLVAVLSACSPETLEPTAVDDCDGLIPIGKRLVEDYLVVVETLPLAVIVGNEPMPAELADLQQRGNRLDQRVVDLECDAVVLNARISTETMELEAQTPAGAAFLDVVRSGVVGELPLPATGVEP